MLVRIFENGFIPGIGRGPFIDPPINVSSQKLETLKTLNIEFLPASNREDSNYISIRKRTIKNSPVIEVDNDKIVEVDNTKTVEESQNIPIVEVDNTKTVEEIKISPIVEIDNTKGINEVQSSQIEEFVNEVGNVIDEIINETNIDENTNQKQNIHDYSNMTKKQIIALLQKNGVNATMNMTKPELIKLAEKL